MLGLSGSLSVTGCAGVTPALTDFSCAANSMTGSGTESCTVTLNLASRGGDVPVQLSSNNAAVKLPVALKIPAKQNSIEFQASVAPVTSTQTVTLTAKAGNVSRSLQLKLAAAVPQLTVNANSVNFGDVYMNAVSTQSITVQSVGTAPLKINSIAVAGSGFELPKVSLPITLNPDQSLLINVEFKPSASGAATGHLVIASNSAISDSATIELSGNGIPSSSFANVSIGTNPGQTISPTFMGLSHEWGWAQEMMGDSSVGVDNIYRQLLQNLTAYGSGPLNLRIGGNSTDYTGEPTPTVTQPFAELATALGTHFFLGVNLGANNPSLAIDQTRAFVSQMPAGSLEAIEIGNEPDCYYLNGLRSTSYTYADYLAEFDTWRGDIEPLLTSGTKLMGASWAYPKTLSNIGSYDASEGSSLATFSQHFYAGDARYKYPADMLLEPKASVAGPIDVTAAVATTLQDGIPFRMGEINSLADGGQKGLSDTFQSALWSVDTMFEYVNVGVSGVNWHMGDAAVYAPFAIKTQKASNGSTYSLTSVNPLYYGLLLFQAATGNNAKLLPTTLNTKANLKAWATVDALGTPRLVLLNKDENSSGTVDITLDGYSHAEVFRLAASSYLATSGVTFAGQTFDGSTDGTIKGTKIIETIDGSNGIFQIPLPITSAALVVFTR